MKVVYMVRERLNQWVTHLTRIQKHAIITAVDVMLIPFSLWLAFLLRLGIVNPLEQQKWYHMALVVLVSIGILAAYRLYRIKLKTFDLTSIRRIFFYSGALILAFGFISFILEFNVSRSITVYFGTTVFIFTMIIRLSAVAILRKISGDYKDATNVIIYGAGSAGSQLALALRQTHEVRPLCFVDDNVALHGLIIAGLKVRSPNVIEQMVQAGKVQRILIAIPSLSTPKGVALMQQFSHLNCEMQIVPSYVDLISGNATVNNLKTVTPDDLLGRSTVNLDTPEIAETYAGRSVLVTGAGGSIGAELCRQLLNCNPRRIVLFERSELALYQIDQLLNPICVTAGIELKRRLASITDRRAVEAAIAEEEIEIVLHAAAYKHVPLVEENEVEGARNNVMGTRIVAEAAAAANIERFILISTDKAVRPTNVMGATKRLAELTVQDIQRRHPSTKMSMVRFGNVLGSSGSVVPLFRRQIAMGGPVTITHSEVTRYFMTIPEAARLVLLAGAYAEGSDLFVLDMGVAVKIYDLAARMIQLSGRTVRSNENPDGDIEIVVSGLRPGEKLYEELLIDDSSLVSTPHEKILRAMVTGRKDSEVREMLAGIEDAIETRSPKKVRQIVRTYVDGYKAS